MIPWVFFLLSKLLDLLVSPIAWTLLLVGASVALRRRRAAPWLAGAAGVALWAFSTDPVSVALMRVAESSAPNTFRPDATYDAAIVLGGGIDPGASAWSGETELGAAGDRIVAGYDLLRSGRARHVLLSAGGPEPEKPVEADWGAALYRRLGIPADRIVLERTSRNTRENALESARIVRERGWKTLVLVTSALHAPRALATFRAAGLSPDVLPVDVRSTPAPTNLWPRAEHLERSTDAIRELVGRIAYRAVGYSRA
jgi:uncharacterized SAM-binding protein YcdF (DUF218 family)